jgi:hypothetical protein
MAELGSGGGTSYPAGIDTDIVKEVDNSTLARADVPNDLAAAIIAIQNELGTDPAGSKADVKTNLQTEHEADGTHGAITPTSVTSATISTDTISEKTATNGVAIDGCTIKDGGVEAITDHGGGSNLLCKVVNIGDWNMDATASVSIAHGVTYSKIRLIQAFVRNDADSAAYPIYHGDGTTNDGFMRYDSTNVVLNVVTGNLFDSVSFDSTSYNRGWITIWYTE